jgi:hypothetical protein
VVVTELTLLQQVLVKMAQQILAAVVEVQVTLLPSLVQRVVMVVVE